MNKSPYAALLALWLASTPNLGAQSGSSGPITAVGCVNRAVTDGSLTGSPGVTPAPPNDAPTLANTAETTGAFLLNNATIPGSPQGTTGSTDPDRPRSFQLDGVTGEFERHVGHQVEVKGTLQAAATGASTAQRTKVDHIKVTAIRMLAASCDAQERR